MIRPNSASVSAPGSGSGAMFAARRQVSSRSAVSGRVQRSAYAGPSAVTRSGSSSGRRQLSGSPAYSARLRIRSSLPTRYSWIAGLTPSRSLTTALPGSRRCARRLAAAG